MTQMYSHAHRLLALALVGSSPKDLPPPPTSITGSTVPYVVDRIIQQGKEANRGRVFIPTG